MNAQTPSDETRQVELIVNGERRAAAAEPRLLLVDFLRDSLGLTGTHAGCEEGVCGACTVLLEGEPTRSCLLLAVQAEGCEVETVESLGTAGHLHPLQSKFREQHGLQCGFCTPGFLMTAKALLAQSRRPTEQQIRDYLRGNICRCTGYAGIVAAVQETAELLDGVPEP